MLKENWVSILYHIVDKHRWKVGKVFKKCKHPRLTKEQRSRKPFLSTTSPSYVALEKVVLDKNLLGAFEYLTSFNHTDTLEVYHSLYNKLCPKCLHFSYSGMIARSQLAVPDHNSGIDAVQSETKTEDKRVKLQFSKYKTVSSNETYESPKLENVPSNIAPIEKPNKEECIKNKRTRCIF